MNFRKKSKQPLTPAEGKHQLLFCPGVFLQWDPQPASGPRHHLCPMHPRPAWNTSQSWRHAHLLQVNHIVATQVITSARSLDTICWLHWWGQQQVCRGGCLLSSHQQLLLEPYSLHSAHHIDIFDSSMFAAGDAGWSRGERRSVFARVFSVTTRLQGCPTASPLRLSTSE